MHHGGLRRARLRLVSGVCEKKVIRWRLRSGEAQFAAPIPLGENRSRWMETVKREKHEMRLRGSEGRCPLRTVWPEEKDRNIKNLI